MSLFEKVIKGITPVSADAATETQNHLDQLLKPLGSLGRLEELAVHISAITGDLCSELRQKSVVVFASDNGICEEGVSGVPSSVTGSQVINMTKGLSGINVLCKQADADLCLIDIGVNGKLPYDRVLNRKIQAGTRNMLKEPAMTREEALRAMEIGIETVRDLAEKKVQVIGTGEMGIGNTSTSATVIMGLTGHPAEEVVGRGVGMKEPEYQHKIRVLKAVMMNRQPDPFDPIDVLAKVGGYDIAGIAGVFLGCAYYKIPAVIDGVISVAGALVAARLHPFAVQYMIPSHLSAEPGYTVAMQELGLSPFFQLKMRLGEGSGCPLTFLLIDAALALVREMGTFEQGGIDGSVLVDMR